ncbi:hypothetical protein BCR42DRAFT_170034 [Absidia repens]|uniref:VASt domain-containing protein n=1 Tax=Absidia repens TaxID=90262 RepID=A0A1X2IWC9_9FUNG|nr:hypothetical protein BCR42DRAFT_170034 [Absidia repens]
MSYHPSTNAMYSSQHAQDPNSSSSSLPPHLIPRSSRRSSLSSMDVTERKGLTPQRSYPSLSSSLKSNKKKTSSRRRSIGSDLGLLATTSGERSNKKIASDKRNRDFHALFKSIPLDDNLIEDYGCALQKEILLQGRIYITQHHLCFNANIFGWITNLVIAFTDIVEIEKRTTAIFIPNAISISTHQSKHFFASFLSREQAHEQMVTIWRHAQQQLSSITMDASLKGSTADDYSNSQYDDTDDDDISLTPWEDHDYDNKNIMKRMNGVNDIVALAPPTQLNAGIGTDRQLSLASLPIPTHTNEEAEAARRRAVSEAGPRPNPESIMHHSAEEPLPSRIITKPETPPLGGTSLALPHRQQHTQCQCADTSDEHYPHTVLDQTYNCSLESLYNLLYHSVFIKKFLTQVGKSSDIMISPWRKGDDIPYVRDVSYIKYLGGAIGPRSTKCILKEELTHIDLNKSITHETTTQTPDVPSGSSFCVKTRACISWAGPGQVRMLVTVLIAFSKSSWLKSTIEKASIDGQINYFKELNTVLRKYTENRLDETSRSKKNRHGKRKGHAHNKDTSSNNLTKDSLPFQSKGFFDRCAQMAGDLFQTSDGRMVMVPTVPQCTMICLLLMVATNLYIAYRMINMGQQLYSMHIDNHYPAASAHSSSPLFFPSSSSSPLDLWRQEHQQDITSMWQWLDQLEKDPWVEQQQQYKWRQHHNNNHGHHHRSFTPPQPKQMNNHISELEKMVHHAEQGVDQVNSIVKQHRDSLLQIIHPSDL